MDCTKTYFKLFSLAILLIPDSILAKGHPLIFGHYHTITEYYINGTTQSPVPMYKRLNSKESMKSHKSKLEIKKRKVVCWFNKLIRTMSANYVDDEHRYVFAIGSKKCFEGIIHNKHLKRITYHYQFSTDANKKTKKSTKMHEHKTVFMSKHYNKIDLFRNAKGKIAYNIREKGTTGINGSYYKVTVGKDLVKISYYIYSFDKLSRYGSIISPVIFSVDIFDKKNRKILQDWHADTGSRSGLEFETRFYDINGKWLKNYAP